MNRVLLDLFIIDDDSDFREMLESFFKLKSLSYRSFDSAARALDSFIPGEVGCVLSDYKMESMDGIALTRELKRRDKFVPIILLTAYGTIPSAVKSVKFGAVDFIEKPFDNNALYELVLECLSVTEVARQERLMSILAMNKLSKLTQREIEILKLLSSGLSNKQIGLKIDISYRTVEVHRSNLMDKLGANSVVDLVRAAQLL